MLTALPPTSHWGSTHSKQVCITGFVFWGGKGYLWGLNKWAGRRGAARTEGGCPQPAGGPGVEPPLWPVRRLGGGREGSSPGLGPPLSRLAGAGGAAGRAEGGRRARRGRGLAEVLFVALDGLLDAQQHGGQPLVQPGDGVVLLHLGHSASAAC